MQSKYLLLDRALRNARRDVWVERDLHWAQWLHRVARYQTPVKALVIISKLGDGLFWYVLIAGLALLGGTNGRDVAAQMVARRLAQPTALLLAQALDWPAATFRRLPRHSSLRTRARQIQFSVGPHAARGCVRSRIQLALSVSGGSLGSAGTADRAISSRAGIALSERRCGGCLDRGLGGTRRSAALLSSSLDVDFVRRG